MRTQLFLIVSLITSNLLFAQKINNQIEIAPFLKWDSYPEFVYAINSVNNNAVTIKGLSWGISSAYKFPINKFYLKAGLGYYRYRFNKINQANSLGGKSNNRIINFIPDSVFAPSILYTTDKYWYNSVSLNIGVEKMFLLTKAVQIIGGLSANNYFTFSQAYHITYPYPEGYVYKTSDKRFFGFSANAFMSLQRKFRKFDIGPSLTIPILSFWKKDKIFPQETDSGNRQKWFRGLEIGFTCTLH